MDRLCDTSKQWSSDKNQKLCPGFRMGRFLEPCLLLLLFEKKSHGYELLDRLVEFGFTEKVLDPGALYRTLRKMEESGVVISQWHTEGAGPAKRLYTLTPRGESSLGEWADHINTQITRLHNFLKRYQGAFPKSHQEENNSAST